MRNKTDKSEYYISSTGKLCVTIAKYNTVKVYEIIGFNKNGSFMQKEIK